MLNMMTRSPFNFWDEIHSSSKLESNSSALAIEAFLDEEKLLLSVDLPGLDKADIDIEVKNSRLTISGERKAPSSNSSFSNKFYGKFSKSFYLNEDLDTQSVRADLDKGVLNIFIPKKKESKVQRIDIQ